MTTSNAAPPAYARPDEPTLTSHLTLLLTESYLAETLASASYEDDRGGQHTDLKQAAASMAEWLGQALAERLGWQPIATAPTGTVTLFCSMLTGDVSKWCFVDWLAGGRFMLHPKWQATHWMPLPSPPVTGDGPDGVR